MKDIYKKSLELLDKYFKETSKDKIERDLNEIDNLNIEGPTFDEYMELLDSNFYSDDDFLAGSFIMNTHKLRAFNPIIENNYFFRNKRKIFSYESVINPDMTNIFYTKSIDNNSYFEGETYFSDWFDVSCPEPDKNNTFLSNSLDEIKFHTGDTFFTSWFDEYEIDDCKDELDKNDLALAA